MTSKTPTPDHDKSANAMWGGRFAGGPDAIMQAEKQNSGAGP